MNYLDIILVILLILAAISGFRKGFIEELAGLVALVLGIWAAIQFSDLAANYLAGIINVEYKYLNILAFILVFVVVIIVVSIIGAAISKLMKVAMLGFLNQLAGLVFGVVKSALVLSVVLTVFDKIDEDVHIIPQSTKSESKMWEPIQHFAPSVFPFLDFWGEKDTVTDEVPPV